MFPDGFDADIAMIQILGAALGTKKETPLPAFVLTPDVETA